VALDKSHHDCGAVGGSRVDTVVQRAVHLDGDQDEGLNREELSRASATATATATAPLTTTATGTASARELKGPIEVAVADDGVAVTHTQIE
jgi:hypothetical protein